MNNTMFVGNIPVDEDVVNVAEITHSDQYDPDSTPNNGITTEDDYASVMINLLTIQVEVVVQAVDPVAEVDQEQETGQAGVNL
ncbi:MAG: hypothetical protein IPN18_08180 [Ignavibacteriales bacterium]|nr:hypothetical protein [Ignavibacteriales bacterium]